MSQAPDAGDLLTFALFDLLCHAQEPHDVFSTLQTPPRMEPKVCTQVLSLVLSSWRERRTQLAASLSLLCSLHLSHFLQPLSHLLVQALLPPNSQGEPLPSKQGHPIIFLPCHLDISRAEVHLHTNLPHCLLFLLHLCPEESLLQVSIPNSAAPLCC